MSSFVGIDKAQQSGQKKENRHKPNNLNALNDLFGIPDGAGDIVYLKPSQIADRKDHKFRPCSDSKMKMMEESVEAYGFITPCIVRPATDAAYPVNAEYEMLAGHTRKMIAAKTGRELPCIVKEGLSEEDARAYVTITNCQRSFEEMTYSERAAVLADYYAAVQNGGHQKQVLDEINSYLETYANPYESRAEEGLSTGWTAGVRDVAEQYDLSKSTIAMYIRIDKLTEEIKKLLDEKVVSVKAAVELSYISNEHQELFVELMQSGVYKCDIEKAKIIRKLEADKKLTIATMTEVLSGLKKKKNPGKPKAFSISGKVMKKYEQYFSPEQDKKEIENVIDKALELYFSSLAE
ncbi:MAG: hypothetical protein EGQ63_01080 [Clostridiales bacterium]|nr:hypothetical protein [Clostridiales bacterium]